MTEPITNRTNVRPRYLGVSIGLLRWNMPTGLRYDFKTTFDRQSRYRIGAESFRICASRNQIDISDGLQDILEARNYRTLCHLI